MSNTTSAQPLQGNVRIYGTGGFGLNLASHFDKVTGQVLRGMAVSYPVYIDTSRSNLKNVTNQENVFLIEGLDGGGKDRSLIHPDVAPHVKAMLSKYPPMDLNIVCFSASGGSGSVIGPLLMAELLSRGERVIGLVVGSDESVKAANNTIRTLKSLENIAELQKAPTIIVYEHNDDETPRGKVDERMRHAIGSLAVLASRQNDELDSADIAHFLRFDKSTTVRPRLATLDIARENDGLDESAQYISMVSLYESPAAVTTKIRPEYHAAGYLPAASELDGPSLFHFAVRVDETAMIAKSISARLAAAESELAARVVSGRISNTDTEVSTPDGLFL